MRPAVSLRRAFGRLSGALLAAVAVLLLAGPTLAPVPASAANDETAQVAVGATTTLELDGNPSTGYSWVFDAGASENADLVTVSDAGYGAAGGGDPGKRPVLGAPKKQKFEVTGVAVGEAKLVFHYARAGGEPEKTEERVVEVLGASE
jgi:predicted secreted protein